MSLFFNSCFFIISFQKDAAKFSKQLVHLQSGPSRQKNKWAGLFGHKVNLVDHYEKKLEDIEESVRLEQSEVSTAAEVCISACFFSPFRSLDFGTVFFLNWISRRLRFILFLHHFIFVKDICIEILK